jgi:hypothetical protein
MKKSMKVAVCTTFPISYYDLCAAEMLASFDMYWPKEVDLYISLDKVSEQELAAINTAMNDLMPSGRDYFISNDWSPEKEAFYARNTDSPDVSYRFQVCRFGHKVFTLKATADHCRGTGYEKLIWLDADVITHKPVTMDDLIDLCPSACASYLGREDAPHSECSFMAFDHTTGFSIIDKMHEYYVTDKVLELPGWTDCDVFDEVMKTHPGKNLSKGLKGWHVFPESPCGKFMEHRKGNRKTKAVAQRQVQKPVLADTMQIKTKNCLPNDLIIANIQENMKLITHWVEYVQPHDEDVVVCSAGQSLSYADIKPWAEKGTKIITVKHAIDRLKAWGIKPWGCVLLDPRQHVEKFIQKPDSDIIYFVASMVDPSVVRTLLENNCKVVGYHAFVGAGEDKMLPKGTMLVAGGSATATRCIGLLHECLGFKNLHCYGYDLCYFTQPDMATKDDAGNLKYMEVTLGAQTWGGKVQNRTFWTEGQFLAQAKELHDLYKSPQGFNIALYGQGIPSWQKSCHEQHKAWVDKQNKEIDTRKRNSKRLNEWEYGITGKSTV